MKYIVLFCLISSSIFAQLPDSLISIKLYPGIENGASINDIVVTKSNAKYLATSAGLYKIVNKTSTPKILLEGSFQTLATNRQEDVWAASGNSIYSLTEKLIDLNNDITTNNMIYHKGSLWIATDQGLYKVNVKTKRRTALYTTSNSKLTSDIVYFVFVDQQDQIWIGTDNGIVLINKRGKWKVYEKGHSMESMTYNQEGLWLVSDKAMWVIDQFGRWYDAALDKGLKEGKVRDITTDKDGRLILASNSLVRYNPYIDEIHSYTDDLGFIAKQTNAIAGDANQDIWIGTQSDGLYLLSFGDTKTLDLTALLTVSQKITCLGNDTGALEVKAFGGNPPYKYKWSDRSLNGKRVSNLVEGSYKVTVTDRNNNSFATEITLKNPYPMTVQFDEINGISKAGLQDGSVKASVSGGIEPYTFAWTDKGTTIDRTDFAAGLYGLTVTDDNDCKVEAEVEIPAEKFIPQLDLASIEIGQTLKVDQLYFSADSSNIEEKFIPVLEEIYAFLSQNSDVVIEIGGHTNNIPPADICYKLSTSRARNIAEYLYKKGLDATRITYKGYGKDKPIATNETLAGRKLNQRVEIKILSI